VRQRTAGTRGAYGSERIWRQNRKNEPTYQIRRLAPGEPGKPSKSGSTCRTGARDLGLDPTWHYMPYFLKLLYLLLPTQIVLYLNSDLYALTPPVSRRFQLLRINPAGVLTSQVNSA
jgi:hypothetical protein